MKIIGFDEITNAEVAILFSEYDPYLIDAKRVKVIGEHGYMIFEGGNLEISYRPCFTNPGNVIVGLRTTMKNLIDNIGDVKKVVNADMENGIAIIEKRNWGMKCKDDDYWKNSKIIIFADGKITREDCYNLRSSQKHEHKVGKKEIKQILKYINNIYETKEDVNNDGCDGTGIQITLTLPEFDVYITNIGYVDGAETLEAFVSYIDDILAD